MTARNIRRGALRWLERTFFLIGGVLATWCLIIILRAEYYARMPVPEPPPAASELPGEDDSDLRVQQPSREHGSWVARLEAPSVALAATVLEGSDEGTLSRAAGHIENTAFPGERGNVGIAGHRDTIFRPLRRLHVGDSLMLTTPDRVFQYRVSDTRIVSPEDVYVLNSSGHPEMTLVTCYPFEFIGHAPRRFIVRADLVTEEARASQAAQTGKPGRAGESGQASDSSSLLPGDRHREEPAVVTDLVVVHTKHQRAVRRHSDRPRVGSNRTGESTDRHRAHRVGAAFKRVVTVGARGLRRALTEINPPRRPERD
jgi:LPXTG-site transpeptidase (sortase) family protein